MRDVNFRCDVLQIWRCVDLFFFVWRFVFQLPLAIALTSNVRKLSLILNLLDIFYFDAEVR